jgi:hypothetical protein
MRSIAVLIACAGVLLNLTAAYGLPKRIIVLRHAEKIDGADLCDTTGNNRAKALVQYLGSTGERNSLFKNGEKPAAFYANTLHSAETIEWAYATWKGKSVELYQCRDCAKDELNKWSREKAHEVLNSAEYKGKIVVMAWEHARIADASKEKDWDSTHPNDPLTLYRLLGIDNYFNGVHLSNWCGSNYDFFWIVDYDPDGNPNAKNGAPMPKSITISQQKFDAPYDMLPTNAWGEPEPADAFKGCSNTPKPECPKQQ